MKEKEPVLEEQIEKSLGWVRGSQGNIFALVLKNDESYAITCNGKVVRICSACNAASAMEIMMATAALDQPIDEPL